MFVNNLKKGLGTSNEKEAVEYFKAIREHKIVFEYEDEEGIILFKE